MDYYLLHKDRTLAIFTLEEEVKLFSINKKYIDYLPLPLKKIVFFRDAYVESEDCELITTNEEGAYLLEQWLDNREIPVNRDNKEKYLKRSSSRKFMLDNHACSLNDCYWLMNVDEQLTWNDIKLYNLYGIEGIVDIERGEYYSGVNSTLGGQLEKFWYTEKDKNGSHLKLCKKEKNTNIIIVREIIASQIYRRLNLLPYCNYEFVYNSSGEVVGCSCDVFTSEDIELITAYDLLEEINCTQADDVYEKIIERAVYYGANKQVTRNYLDVQTIVDFIITNRDRHQGNIAFLRDSETLKLIGPAPVFDSGSSRHLEREKPETVLNTTVNGLYRTEMECIEHVLDLSVVDLNKLLDYKEYRDYLLLSNEHNIRIDALLNLYKGKLEWLKKQLR
ncbi:MAG: hypothetical protein ACI4A3_04635 [Lachnospiraceae bacterium]